ncbi:MAG TPA: hypothetical protein VFV99_17365 [Kofleriaceae bacterium]|nr:hypothetical protein [Kofleriaceae bacterium]
MSSFRVALLVMVVGCNSSGGSHDWVPPDIDEQQTLDRIGSAAYGKLCDAFADYVHDQYRSNYLVKAACTAHALETTMDAVACGDAVNMCLDTLPPVVDQQLNQILAQASCPAANIDPTLCSAPVSALTACLDALGEKVDELELSATCAAFGSPVPQDWWIIDEPAECAALRSGC